MTIDTAAIRNTLEMLEGVRVDTIARLNVAEAACDAPEFEENFALHRSTWEDRKREAQRIAAELNEVCDEIEIFVSLLRDESDCGEPMEVHESPYTTGYYGSN